MTDPSRSHDVGGLTTVVLPAIADLERDAPQRSRRRRPPDGIPDLPARHHPARPRGPRRVHPQSLPLHQVARLLVPRPSPASATITRTKGGGAVILTPAQLDRIGELKDHWSFLWDKRRSLWIAAEDCPDGEQFEEAELDGVTGAAHPAPPPGWGGGQPNDRLRSGRRCAVPASRSRPPATPRRCRRPACVPAPWPVPPRNRRTRSMITTVLRLMASVSSAAISAALRTSTSSGSVTIC
jgi:hypothetical protein